MDELYNMPLVWLAWYPDPIFPVIKCAVYTLLVEPGCSSPTFNYYKERAWVAVGLWIRPQSLQPLEGLYCREVEPTRCYSFLSVCKWIFGRLSSCTLPTVCVGGYVCTLKPHTCLAPCGVRMSRLQSNFTLTIVQRASRRIQMCDCYEL